MCGICGILELDGATADIDAVRRMSSVLVHRGPDGEGERLLGCCALGHRRLSIIDVEGSPQPMEDRQSGAWISYNGEIYNYRSLRGELEREGASFDTDGDTEVLLKLIAREGVEGLSRLNGIFAFALWEPNRQRLLLARDRLGVKPLYYWCDKRRLAFASEVKALLETPGFSGALDEQSLASYLIYANVHGPRTLLRDVRKLPPGGYAIVENGTLRQGTYWELPEPEYDSGLTVESAVPQLRELLEDSVQLQMVSDVPVGSLCSGGLDSSLISAICTTRAGHTFNTYNATFPEGPPYDESSYAKKVASHISSQHHSVLVDANDVAEGMLPLIWHLDEPIHHSSSVPIYYVCRLAAQSVKVLLSGEGADEMFAGYPRYRLLRMAMLGSSPAIGGVLRAAARLVPNRRRREKLAEHLGLSVEQAVLFNVTTVRRDPLLSVLRPEWREAVEGAPLAFERDLWGSGPEDHESLLRRMLRFEQGTYLGTSLDRLDKMGMAASIEGRVPFLDHRLPEFSARLRLRSLLDSRGRGKIVLKRAASGWLPEEIIYRKKWGFGLPMASVLRSPRLEAARKLLWEDDARTAEIFDRDALRTCWELMAAGRDDLGDLIWRALNLEIWCRLFLDRSMKPMPPPGSVESSLRGA